MYAYKIRDLDGFTGRATLYRVSDYVEVEGTDEVFQYIVVSATVVPSSGPETYIFPADENGKITDWGELPGSYRGGLDHAQALMNGGFEIIDPQLSQPESA